MATVQYSEDATNVYVDISEVPPLMEIYAQIKSAAAGGNTSTEGVTAALHKKSTTAGTVRFRVVKDFLLPDLPRLVITEVSHEVSESSKLFE